VTSPLVSVLIPTYNSASFVQRALQSVLNQTYANLEVIVSDNASKDRTWEIVTNYAEKDSRVRCLRQPANVGPLKNWQTGLTACTGKYVKIVWSDDWIEPLFVEESVRRLEEDPDAGLVFTGVIIHGEESHSTEYFHHGRQAFDLKTYVLETILLNNMPISPGCALIRRSDATFQVLPDSSQRLREIGINLGAGPDVLFMLMAAIKYKRVAHIPKLYTHFTSRPDSFTGTQGKAAADAHCETLELFLKTVAAPKLPGIVRRVRVARTLEPLIRIGFGALRKMQKALRG
jgi:glycosyltransferase involved in cell wall biosynthesis